MTDLLLQIQTAPEVWCWRAIPELADLHRSANFWIFAAYFPLGIEMCVLSIFTWYKGQRVGALFLSTFGTFIWMCGIGHAFSSYVVGNTQLFGHDAFWMAGYWHLATAVVSLFVAIAFTICVGLMFFSPARLTLFFLTMKAMTMPSMDTDAGFLSQLDDLRATMEAFNNASAR